jgi:hypothetical protein
MAIEFQKIYIDENQKALIATSSDLLNRISCSDH